MRIKSRDVYTGRFFRSGKSHVIVVPPDLMDKAGLVPGSTMLMNFEYGMIWLKQVTKAVAFNREDIAKVFDHLFPDKADDDASKRNSGQRDAK